MKSNNIHTDMSEAEVGNAVQSLYDDAIDNFDSHYADEIEYAYAANFLRAKDALVYLIGQGKTEITESDCLLAPSMQGSLKIVRETINFLLAILALEILGDDNGERVFEIDLSRKAIAI